ncbi:two-component system response regulator [Leeia oryzae]|uniref:two-component system response regulator n=1 Tax=Leeia oryzae TaxID=356662 RepID=UPI0003769A05|nr:GGDEF domain-containing phosphodiesterase [Leeia oryzae]
MPDEPVKILIVDDDDVDREKMRRILSRLPRPNQITEAVSFNEALEALNAAAFDCILLDFRLGDGEGKDLIPTIHISSGKHCPIIMVTGFNSESGAVEALHSGVYDYLSKAELDSKKLHSALERSLQWSSIQRDLLEAEDKLRRQSLYDALTQLPNRNLFFDRLEHTHLAFKRDLHPYSLLMMDLNRFKEVNDSLGHAAGDTVLKEVAQRLALVMRKTDTLARLGGDEFVAILQGVDTEIQIQQIAEKMIASLANPIRIDDNFFKIGVSIGAVIVTDEIEDVSQLMSKADRAMYHAKRTLKGLAFDSKELEVSNSLLQTTQIERALNNNEILLHFQPKVDLLTHEVVGLEALARWERADGTIVYPIDFIPTAESSPLIERFTYTTLELALIQSQQLQSKNIVLPIAINLSPRMLESPDMEHRILDLMAQYKIPHHLITFEITETTLIINPLTVKDKVNFLKDNGILFSVDDFGAGFTSFNLLKALPISEIKLDRAFIENITENSFDAHFVKGLAVFCEGLGIRLVAEGVEHAEAWPILLKNGCHILQGYSIGRPMPAGTLVHWLENWQKTAPGQ